MSDFPCGLAVNTICETFLTRGQAIGLLIVAEAGILSVVAVLFLFIKMIQNILRHYRTHPQNGWRQLITSPLEVYILSLLIGDLIHGVAIALVVRWVAEGTVRCGGYCTAEGVIQQMGDAIAAMSTLAIAVHTFVIVLFRRGAKAVLFATIVVCLIWMYIILFIAISISLHTRRNVHFETPTPYWCWIGSNFLAERIAGEYFWFWFTALLSLVLYVILFFCLRGNIVTEENRWWKIHFRILSSGHPQEALAGQTSQITDNGPHGSRDAAKVAFMMLLYPVSYAALILPISIVRWIDFVPQAHHPSDNPNSVAPPRVPSAPIMVAQSILALGGVVNVILLLCTRPGILLLGEVPTQPERTPVFNTLDSVYVGEAGRDRSNLKLRTFIPMQDVGGEDNTG